MIVLSLVSLVLAQEPPAPLDPTEAASEASDGVDSEASPAPTPPEDPLARCKAMLLDETSSTSNDDARLAIAESCFRDHTTSEDAEVAARARAMVDVVAAWRATEAVAATVPVAVPIAGTAAATTAAPAAGTAAATTRESVSLTGLVESGRAEALLNGAAAGAGGGFLLSATFFSANRTINEQDSLPWLLASPAVGAVAGAAGAWALVESGAPSTGDIAFVSSTMWNGAAQGLLLQTAVFDGNAEVSSTPLRFVTVLGGGAIGLASGIALSPFLDVTQGDAAVANSAALWGGVLTAFGMGFFGASGTQITLGQGALVLAAGSTVPYVAVVVAHPYLNIERWPSWLIEGGGVGGLLVTSAFMGVLNTTGSLNGQAAFVFLGGGTAAGLAAGTAAAVIVSNGMRSTSTSTELDVPPVEVSLLPAVFPADGPERPLTGFIVAGAF